MWKPLVDSHENPNQAFKRPHTQSAMNVNRHD